MTWHYMTLHGNTLQHITWPCMARHYSTWHDSTRHDRTWPCMARHDSTWHDRTWPCMARHDSTWHDSAFPYEVLIQDTTRHDNSCAHRKGERTEEKKKAELCTFMLLEVTNTYSSPCSPICMQGWVLPALLPAWAMPQSRWVLPALLPAWAIPQLLPARLSWITLW